MVDMTLANAVASCDLLVIGGQMVTRRDDGRMYHGSAPSRVPVLLSAADLDAVRRGLAMLRTHQHELLMEAMDADETPTDIAVLEEMHGEIAALYDHIAALEVSHD